jgi:transcriptional regulator with XRE-family HTH domain
MTDEQASAIEQRIGARVLIARTRRQLSAQDLAVRAGMHRNTIYRLESGIGSCSVACIYRIAQALEISAGELLP